MTMPEITSQGRSIVEASPLGRPIKLRRSRSRPVVGRALSSARKPEGLSTRPLGLVMSMPADLTEIVDGFGAETRKLIWDNWEGLSEAGRQKYRIYVAKAWTRSGRQVLCVRAATQLIGPARNTAHRSRAETS
jgi:hypothetical protein